MNQVPTMKQLPFLALIHFNLLICAGATTYFITPTKNTSQCPQHPVNTQPPCMTLSDYAAKPMDYFDSNSTTLIFQTGHHILEWEFNIENVTCISIYASVLTRNDNNLTTGITCMESAMFRFVGVDHVHISGLSFTGCIGNRAVSVAQITIVNCHFQGLTNFENSTMSGLELIGVTYANISQCSWHRFNSVSTIQYSGGAAIKIISSRSVFISDSLFSGNIHSSYGGALYVMDTSLIVARTIFTNNSAGSCGAVGGIGSDITILRCDFLNNTVGMWGGAFCNAFEQSSTVTRIESSKFVDNVAGVGCGAVVSRLGKSVVVYNTVFVNNNGLFTGGALCMETVIEAHVVKRTEFVGNGGGYSAGSILVLNTNITFQGYLNVQDSICVKGMLYSTNSTLTFLGNSSFTRNYGSLYAYSSKITFAGNTTFRDNRVLMPLPEGIGGAISSFRCDITTLGTTQFLADTAINNGGAIFAIESRLFMYGNVTFAYNAATVSGGGIYAYMSELSFGGRVYITNNTADKGAGIYAISTTTKLDKGSLLISSNIAKQGGGMYLGQGAKLYVLKSRRESTSLAADECTSTNCVLEEKEWLRMEFTNNTADYGGAVYVTDNGNSGICGSHPANLEHTPTSQCFLQAIAAYIYDSSSLHVRNLYFSNNTAKVAGGIIYGGLLDRCTVSPFAEINLIYSQIATLQYLTNITNLKVKDVHSEISSAPVQICFCREEKHDCSYQPPTVYIKKGQKFRVSLVAVDQVGNPHPATVKASLSSYEGGMSEGQSSQNTTSSCTNLEFTIFSPYNSEQLLLHADGPCKDIGISQRQLQVTFHPCSYCPLGFKVPTLSCTCNCDPNLFPEYVSNCSLENESVLRRGNVWISYINKSENNEGYVTHPHCPFDYCYASSKQVYINLNVPNGSDTQCAFNHSGKLCGSCKDGLSLSLGSSRCKPCTHYTLLLLLPFSIAGIALVVFLLVCNLTVAVGTVNGLIFYANIIAANSTILLPFEKPNLLTVFIAWINLDFGFETCFYDGMDSYSKTWLQFVFPLYLILLVVMVIIISEYSTPFSRLISNKNPVATLATLILLSYTKLLRTIIAALSFTTLHYPEGSSEKVWLADASIRYFQRKNIPLLIAALLVIFIGLCYTILLLLWQWLLRCPKHKCTKVLRNTKLYCFMDTYHAPYNARYRYWTGLLLLARITLYLVAALNILGDPSINLLAIVIVTGLLYFVMTSLNGKVYKKHPLNVLESLSILNLIVIAVGTSYIRQSEGQDHQHALALTSISIAFVEFLAIVAYHTYAFVLPKRAKRKLKRRFSLLKDKKNDIELNNFTTSERSAQNDASATNSEENSTSKVARCTFSVVEIPQAAKPVKDTPNINGALNSYVVTDDSLQYCSLTQSCHGNHCECDRPDDTGEKRYDELEECFT